jgi:large subunit ribosomal protein L37Ae
MSTKKVGYTGKYGTRYGKKIRTRLLKAGAQKRHKCPSCFKTRITRRSAGIWECDSCGLKFAGKAYRPSEK